VPSWVLAVPASLHASLMAPEQLGTGGEARHGKGLEAEQSGAAKRTEGASGRAECPPAD
jgi:hypothetical protein